MTTDPVHRDLAAGRWRTLSLAEQMGNVGTEVDRALRAHQRNDRARWERAFARALELFDLTATDTRWAGPRRREQLRAREAFCSVFLGDAPAPGDAEFLSRYFLQFAVAARRER
jgi:hypothetical protein